jgi:TonB family protein
LAVGLAIAMLACAARAGPAAPRPQLPTEGVVTNPDWVARPSGDVMADYYPELANAVGLAGDTAIVCVVAETGKLTDCQVRFEKPAGLGFGEAALKMASLFQMRPRTLDGVPVGGAKIIIPIDFNQPTSDEPVVADDVGGSSPTETALALARRLVADNFVTNGAAHEIEATTQKWREVYSGGTREQKLAIEANHEAWLEAVPVTTDRMARFYASALTIPELTEAVHFFESPAGKAWSAQTPNFMVATAKRYQLQMYVAKKKAKASLCRQIACLPVDTPADSAAKTSSAGSSPAP